MIFRSLPLDLVPLTVVAFAAPADGPAKPELPRASRSLLLDFELLTVVAFAAPVGCFGLPVCLVR